MSEDDRQKSLMQSVAIALFLIFAISSLAVFTGSAASTITAIIHDSTVIEFNKGFMYLLGCGLISGLLIYFMVQEVRGKKITPSLNKRITKIGVALLVLMFLFPQLADVLVRNQVNSNGYEYCSDKSYRWLHYQKVVFVKDSESCALNLE